MGTMIFDFIWGYCYDSVSYTHLNAITDDDFFKNPAFIGAVENCKKHGTALHLIGLLSDGGVHSHNTHPVSYTHLDVYKRQTI